MNKICPLCKHSNYIIYNTCQLPNEETYHYIFRDNNEYEIIWVNEKENKFRRASYYYTQNTTIISFDITTTHTIVLPGRIFDIDKINKLITFI